MDTIRIDPAKAKVVAHRGVSGIEKENTASAFVAAGNRSYFGIETDVHRTLDGKFVCIHDDTTKRVAIDDLTVEESTFDTLMALNLTDTDGNRGRRDLRIPTLKDYVRICKKYSKIGVLELKNHFEESDIKRIIAEITEEDYLSGIIFISFDLANLVTVRRLLPEQKCQYLVSEFRDDLISTLKSHRLDLDIHYKALTDDGLRALKQNDIEVNVWTVDDKAEAERLARNGVDYITSNILE